MGHCRALPLALARLSCYILTYKEDLTQNYSYTMKKVMSSEPRDVKTQKTRLKYEIKYEMY